MTQFDDAIKIKPFFFRLKPLRGETFDLNVLCSAPFAFNTLLKFKLYFFCFSRRIRDIFKATEILKQKVIKGAGIAHK